MTFHTPPYAAVEQYVKTYPQGPWTDIYALAVVLYECVTGEKPPEVLERLHGGLGTPLAEGHWPGFSKRFLQAIDAGMTIQPDGASAVDPRMARPVREEGCRKPRSAATMNRRASSPMR